MATRETRWFGVRCDDGAVWLVAAFAPRPDHIAMVDGPPWKAVARDEMESTPERPVVQAHTGWNARAAVASLSGDMAWDVVELIACEGALLDLTAAPSIRALDATVTP